MAFQKEIFFKGTKKIMIKNYLAVVIHGLVASRCGYCPSAGFYENLARKEQV